MSRLLDSLPDGVLEPARKRAVPKQPAPMLATLTDRRFSDDGWIYERKLDGERCLALRDGKKQVRLLSRNGKDLGDTYPELTEALEGQPPRRFVVDGETPPFADDDLPTKGTHWVTPNLVAEVGFTEWTADGKLRHPRFLGLRRDKEPEDVVRERPEA